MIKFRVRILKKCDVIRLLKSSGVPTSKANRRWLRTISPFGHDYVSGALRGKAIGIRRSSGSHSPRFCPF